MSLSARLIGALLLLPALLLQTGCGCIRTVASVRASDEMRRTMQKELEAREGAAAKAAAPSPDAPGTSAFDTESRLESLRDAFTSGRWDAVRHDGLGLVTAAIDDVTKLEVLSMLADAFRQSGDAERAREFTERFRKLYEELRNSDKMAKEGRERTAILNTLGKFKRRAQADLFATADGEQRTNFKLAEKLRSGGTDEVLTEELGDGGTVYFSRSAEALEGKVPRELTAAIQKDPEFEYYFALTDAPPPSPSPGAPKK